MPIIECQSHEEYLAKLAELKAAGTEISSVYLYWYEGAGKRRELISKGPAATAMWEPLSLKTKMELIFAMWSPQPPEHIKALLGEYRDCLRKDYQSEGGYSEVTGDPKDAVIVIETK